MLLLHSPAGKCPAFTPQEIIKKAKKLICFMSENKFSPIEIDLSRNQYCGAKCSKILRSSKKIKARLVFLTLTLGTIFALLPGCVLENLFSFSFSFYSLGLC
jgi:hypothetical protein